MRSGSPRTRLRRRMMDLDAARRGDENVSSPGELRRLMEAVHEGAGLSSARAADLRAVASVPKWGTPPGLASPFRTPLPDTLRVLDKAGELEGVRCVTAVVDLPGRPYSVAIMTAYLRRAADGEEAIRAISAALFETFDRLARSSEFGRVISSNRHSSSRTRSSNVSRRRTSRTFPSSTNASAARGRRL